jgi:hypothetical protein
VLLGMIGAVAFLHFAVAFLTTAYLSGRRWLLVPGYGAFAAAVCAGLIAHTTWFLPVTSLFVVVLALVPGLILMRAERKA